MYVSRQVFRVRRVGGAGVTSHQCEATGATEAVILATQLLRNCPALRTVLIRGDNHSVVTAMATRTESLSSVPGRSPCPATYRNLTIARMQLDDVIRTRPHGASVEFQWIPRRFNSAADHLATCAIQGTQPNWHGVEDNIESLPTVYGPPSEDELNTIATRVYQWRCWRSITPRLLPAWHALLARVAAWGSPWALLLAPTVLLRRATDSPISRLVRMAAVPGLLEQYYWHAAHDIDRQVPTTTTTTTEMPWRDIEKMASQAPARAVKKMSAAKAATGGGARAPTETVAAAGAHPR